MNHQDHVNLLRRGIVEVGSVWADFGSGAGAFTLALADLLGPGGEIYCVDKDRSALKEEEKAMRTYFPDKLGLSINADFTQRLALSSVVGVVMGNSLPFLRQEDAMLQVVCRYLMP